MTQKSITPETPGRPVYIKGGFIYAPRSWFDSDLWIRKPASWLKAWLFIMFKAVYEPRGDLKRGQCLVSWTTCQAELHGVTKRQWHSALDYLKELGWIQVVQRGHLRLITVLIYEATQRRESYGAAAARDFKDTLIPEPEIPEWLKPCARAWLEIMGGEMPIGIAKRHLAPLIQKHGAEAVAVNLRIYLARLKSPNHASLPKFAQSYARWTPPEAKKLTPKQRAAELKRRRDDIIITITDELDALLKDRMAFQAKVDQWREKEEWYGKDQDGHGVVDLAIEIVTSRKEARAKK